MKPGHFVNHNKRHFRKERLVPDPAKICTLTLQTDVERRVNVFRLFILPGHFIKNWKKMKMRKKPKVTILPIFPY